MGNLWSNNNSVENQETSSTQYYYYYPPKNGSRFFGSTFIMGNDKFDMSQPESYLFGENFDLNYLGGKPSPFPYTAPLPNEPMQMLKSLINIRKETLKLISPEHDETKNNANEDSSNQPQYKIEFIFDSDVDCAITVYFLCKEEISSQGLNYIPKDISYRSETFHYKRGIGQLFSETSPVFNPQNYNMCDLIYNILDEKGEFNHSALYPVVINCLAEEGDSPRQSHSLIAIIEKAYDQIFLLKAIKQKIFVDGLTYLLQEIYGIENKADKSDKVNGGGGGGGPGHGHHHEDENDKSLECVICMSDLRDTLILPCRHLCLCQGCADSLRFQANNCPICRVPFRALLQIKAVRKIPPVNEQNSDQQQGNNSRGNFSDSLNDVILVDIPPGYETIPLVDALNGTTSRRSVSMDKIILVSLDAQKSAENRKEEDNEDETNNKENVNNNKQTSGVSTRRFSIEDEDKLNSTNDNNNIKDKESTPNSSSSSKATSSQQEDGSSSTTSSLSGSGNTSGNQTDTNIQEKTLLLSSKQQKSTPTTTFKKRSSPVENFETCDSESNDYDYRPN